MAYESKRFTPKKSGSGAGAAADAQKTSAQKTVAATSEARAQSTSGRYTPRATPSAQGQADAAESPAWVAWLMFALFALGLLIIVLNYTNIWWTANNWALIGGLVAIVLGFITATRLR
jgi:Cell division protein CrgA